MKNPVERVGKNGFLYESVAERISHLIERGTLSAGARVPSVRRLSQQFQVSITTVMEAYRLLEDRGWIEARPQSGYYVCGHVPMPHPGSAVSEPVGGPTEVSVSHLLRRLLRDSISPGLLPLGIAMANPALLPA